MYRALQLLVVLFSFKQADPFGKKLYLCGPSWGIPGATWKGLLGSSVPLGVSWECLGEVSAASWRDLEASGRVLGPLEATFGGMLAQSYI